MKILYASPETIPFAKTGGLADVAGSLPKALKKLGKDIRVVMPKYGCIPGEYTDKMEFLGYIYVNIGWRHQYSGIFKLIYNDVAFYFVDNEYYFKRESLYGHYDEAERFVFFSKAIIEMLPLIGFKPDIIHCNDWQTGIVSLLLKANYSHLPFYKNIKTMFTIHNLKYQGVFPKEILESLIGVGWEYFTADGIEFYDSVNFLKAGIAFSDVITTVSKTYAKEIKYEFYGENLHGFLDKRSKALYGILNGIDFEQNDPATDKRLFANYDAENTEGKHTNKKMLQESLGLPQRGDMPVVGIISRLVGQKGFDLVEGVFEDILSMDIQLAVLGTGEQKYEDMFRNAAEKFPDKVSANICYDEVLAQRIYAGADMFLMPSLFEPCGLSQLFSMRYGTVPIVRETGGLCDTVKPYNEVTGEGIGFSFTNYNAHDMIYTIRRAVSFYNNRDVWGKLVRNCMLQNYSWDASAQEYERLYDRLARRT